MLRIFTVLAIIAWTAQLHAAPSVVRQVSNMAFEANSPWDVPYFQAPRIYNNELYFSASTGRYETRLFATDGRQLRSFDVAPGHSVGSQSIEFQSELYFRGDDGNGIELFRTDGHTLTNLDLAEGPEGSWPHDFQIVGDDLYFQGGRTDSDGNAQSLMFRINGGDVQAIADTNTNSSYSWGATAGDKFYFPANGADGLELHRADGPSSRQIIDVNPGPGNSDPWPMGELNGELYFTAIGPDGRGLYRTEGDGAIQLPYEPAPGPYGGPVNFVRFGDSLYFQGEGEDGAELYRTDGNSVTHLDLNPGPLSSGAVAYASQEVNGKLIVPGQGTNGWAIFVIDADGNLSQQFDLGEVPLTTPPSRDYDEEIVREETRGFANRMPLWLHEFQGGVYFQGTGTSGPDLFKTDGNTLTKFNLVPTSGDLKRGVATYDAEALGDELYFSASTSQGVELVKTDGVSTTIFDLAPGLQGSSPQQLEVVGDELVFQTHFDSITTIYATDGNNTRKLAEFPDLVLDPATSSAGNIRSVTDFIPFGNQLFFLGRTEHGWRLHRIGAVPEPSGLTLVVVPALLASVRRKPFRASRRERVPLAAAPPR